MLKTRLFTASILAAIVIYSLSFSPVRIFHPLFTCLICSAMFFAGSEFIAMRWSVMESQQRPEMARPKIKLKHYFIGFSYSFIIAFYYVSLYIFKYNLEKVTVIAMAWIILSLLVATVLIYRKAININEATNKLLNVISGFIYISIPGICAMKLSIMNIDGSVRSAQTYFCLATILMGDTGAYFIGTRFGKHKLIPKISPKKSVEGALGGLLFSVLTAIGVTAMFSIPFPYWFSIVVGLCIGTAGQIGDLLESAIKRAGGFKDSSRLLPGHGGVLDRIDSLILGLPVTYVLFYLYFS